MPALDVLIELLQKIDKTTAKLHIDVDHNGREWFWTINQSNMTASEWTQRDLKPKSILNDYDRKRQA